MDGLMEHPIEMDDLGGTPIFGKTHVWRILTNLYNELNGSQVVSSPASSTAG